MRSQALRICGGFFRLNTFIMNEQIVFRQFEKGELIFHRGSTITYRGRRCSPRRTAYLRRSKAVCNHTKTEWMNLLIKYDYQCCNPQCESIGDVPTKDHIIPISRGGSSAIDNIQPLCRECNKTKGNKVIDYRKKLEL